MIDSVNSVSNGRAKSLSVEKGYMEKVHNKILSRSRTLLLEKGWLFYIVGFLLGRAVILSQVSPFAIAFLATTWFIHKRQAAKVMLAILAGSLSYEIAHGVFILLAMIVFTFLAGLLKTVKHREWMIPLLVFLSTSVPRMFFYSLSDTLSPYEWMLLSVEGVLGAVLVLIFMQSVPIIAHGKFKPALKNEEIVCMIILIASILTGTIGWHIFDASMEQILSRYIVLVFAFVGGAAIGSTVGVVAGLILSLANVANLYQMSLLAFSGLLGGLLKDGKKIGVVAGLMVGTVLVGIYSDTHTLLPSIAESLIASIIFFLTPAGFFQKVSRYIPGTEEYTNEQEAYLQKVRNVTAKRVEQFSNVFEALSKSFTTGERSVQDRTDARKETDYFLSNVTEKTCQACFMKERCWEKMFDKTYSLMDGLKEELEEGHEPNQKLRREFENHCIKSKKVINTMKDEMSFFEANQKLKKQVMDSKRFVADQLQGVSEVMENFSQEIMKEREQHEKQEAEIINALKHMGIALEKLDIYRLEKGNVDIEMTVSFYEYHGEGTKVIAPAISDILNEMIVVTNEEVSPFLNGYCYLGFGSAKEFVVKTGTASAARGGGLISGDSHTTMELGTGKYAMAISDGMGNGKRASEESGETLRLLRQILQSGIEEQVAIKSINSILALRTTDEIFATLDLAVINMHNAFVRFLKISSVPSFVKRGEEIHKIEASNLPMGIVRDVEVDMVGEQLKSGDILIMISDGIYDGPKHIENTDMWINRKLKEMRTDEPQEIADLLLEEVIRSSGDIGDDMTVLVAKVDKYIPDWTAIPLSKKAQ